MSNLRVPTWIKVWMGLSALICLWDGLFVLNRPKSLVGGSLAHFWPGYDLYVTVDRLYADMDDGFVLAQSWCNLVEILLTALAVYKNHTGKPATAYFLAFSVSLMTLYKTVLYLSSEWLGGWPHTGHNEMGAFLTTYLLPSGFWVVLPLLAVMSLGSGIVSALSDKPHDE